MHGVRAAGVIRILGIVRVTASVRAAGVFDSMYFLDVIRSIWSFRGISVVRVTRSIVRVVHGYNFFAGTRLCALSAADGTVMVYGFLRACFGADAHGRFRLPFLGKCRYGEKRQRHAEKQQDTEQSFLHSRFPFDGVGALFVWCTYQHYNMKGTKPQLNYS